MKRFLIAGIALGAGALLGSCATMSEEQCLVGDWGERGHADGAEGYPMSRLDDHAKACAKYGVAPNLAAYESARTAGLDLYCRRDRGFQEGREGDAYHGVCSRAQEVEFLPAYQDGQVVHEAEQALTSARSNVDSLGDRLEELDEKIESKRSESRDQSLTQEQRDRARDRVGELRRERADTERNWRRAQNEVDDADRRARDVRWRFQDVYGSW